MQCTSMYVIDVSLAKVARDSDRANVHMKTDMNMRLETRQCHESSDRNNFEEIYVQDMNIEKKH